MLNGKQISYLIRLGDLNAVVQDNAAVGLIPRKKLRHIEVSYDDFKKAMGLDDIRFHWMLGPNVFLAGGAVLEWIDSEFASKDFDFYFTNKQSSLAFENLVLTYQFVKINSSSLTDTYKTDDGAIIQLVGVNERETTNYYGEKVPREWMLVPKDALDRFDFHATQFAVDSDKFYTTNKALESLLSKLLTLNAEKTSERRYKRYIEKGFLPVNGTDYHGSRSTFRY